VLITPGKGNHRHQTERSVMHGHCATVMSFLSHAVFNICRVGHCRPNSVEVARDDGKGLQQKVEQIDVMGKLHRFDQNCQETLSSLHCTLNSCSLAPCAAGGSCCHATSAI